MVHQIRIEHLTELEIYRHEDSNETYITLLGPGANHILTIILPPGDILDTVANQLLHYSLYFDHEDDVIADIPF